ncbi:MAG TPA: HEPN domain-containing protein [Caldisericia bacterium]|nr:HEPN domain-containing protein [Caldisericia bacterium]
MKDDKLKEALRWIRQASEDIDAAKYNHKGKKFFVSCFLSHQVVEKILKGYLIYKGFEHIWGHSISDLSKECEKIDKDFESLRKEILILDKYYIPTRYPNGLPGGIPAEVFTERDSFEAINLSEKALKFIFEKERELKENFDKK